MADAFVFREKLTEEPPEGDITGLILPNGLRVVMLKRHTTPIVAVDLWYLVGSKNEQPGKSGFAHLFEHMMFEGSQNVGKAQHMKIINDVGGTVNGSTTQDRTNYWEVVPANQLELVLWLEADRMRALDLSEENFENQRATVKEERRMRVDNQPYMRVLYELKDELAYQNFAYRHSVIGSMADLDNARLADVREFHDLYYRPNNAIMAIAGDFKALRAQELLRRYFADIPAGPPLPPVDLTEPPQTAEKRLDYQDPFAPFPAYLVSYHVPARHDPDFYAVEILENILLDGESARLYRQLIEKSQVALHLFGGTDGKLGPGLLFVFAQMRPGVEFEQLEGILYREIDTLRQDGISEAEMQKAKNKVRANFYSQQETVRNAADMLCQYTTVFNQPDLLYREIERFEALTRNQVEAAARRYLRPENRSVIRIFPKAAGGEE